MVRIGTAGWVIPRQNAEMAAGEGSHLERYARVMNCVEINSSFHRAHRPATWAKWAEAVPEDFRFSVKFPKTVTHEAKLAVPAAALDGFFAETAGLGNKLGVVLVQLPPSLGFEDSPAAEFFEALRDRWQGAVALEPRHASWFGADAEELMQRHRVGRVAADPVRKGAAALQTGGWDGLAYFRLHGSPRMYYSAYEAQFLAEVLRAVKGLPEGVEKWLIFDNKALGEAFGNALELQGMIKEGTKARPGRTEKRGVLPDGPTARGAVTS
jgi:uncharacterized protein YecE (DUF72 family)